MSVARITRSLDAPPADVWHALTDPAALAAWFWPARLAPEVTGDPRPGGAYRIAARDVPMAVSGTYREVDEGRRLVLDWRWDGEDQVSAVTIELTGATEVAVTHVLPDDASAQRHAEGWSQCLDRLPGYLASPR